MSRLSADRQSALRNKAEQFFAEATSYALLSREHFFAFAEVTRDDFSNTFSSGEWQCMRWDWARRRLKVAMDRLYAEVTIRDEFIAPLLAQYAGVSVGILYKVSKQEWTIRRATLPTYQERILVTIQEMQKSTSPLSTFTYQGILERAGLASRPEQDQWFFRILRAARLEVMQRQHEPVGEPPPGKDLRLFSGEWIDLESDCWEVLAVGSRPQTLRRDCLRQDLAPFAWSYLREEMRSGELAIGTIVSHYQAFMCAGEALGETVPDVATATQEAVQRAWLSYQGTNRKRVQARMGMTLIFASLLQAESSYPETKREEVVRIVNWLRMVIRLPAQKPGEEFLSEDEVNAVLRGCLTDIVTGMTYLEAYPNLLTAPTHPLSEQNAFVIVSWTAALMVLLMAFTGLRRQSVVELNSDDWVEIRPGCIALAWRHGKKGEENVAILPVFIAEQLDRYVQATAKVRTQIQTQRVFLKIDRHGLWSPLVPHDLQEHLDDFVVRYHLARAGSQLPLTSTILRRTYTTRALYEGQNIQAIRLQLGHVSPATTLRYLKFDRYQHPAEVRAALDAFGKKSLPLWHTPCLLQELEPAERTSLLATGKQREQDVGLCRYDRCIQAERGSPPPCSLCEHLVTGPAFLAAWEEERVRREEALRSLASIPYTEMVLAQMKLQFEHFQANFAYVRGAIQR